jgi:hypothetical protein
MTELPERNANGHGPSAHGPDCGCVRCTGFQPGNELSLGHGAYAVVALGPRTDEIAHDLRPLVPGYSPSDEPAVRLLSLAFGRLERAQMALDQLKPDEAARLRSDALGWANAARRLLNDLGMTPLARSRLGLTLARGESVVVALQRESREREQAVEP